jgi:GNAT superfamily N-acetyltransferase
VRESQVVAGTAFGRPKSAVEAMADALSTPEVVADRRVAVATAHMDGRMVGSGTLWLAHGVGGILNVGTLDEARGRGIGYAVTLALLWRANEIGATLAALHASPQGYPIYLRMGFSHDGDVRVLRGPADLR